MSTGMSPIQAPISAPERMRLPGQTVDVYDLGQRWESHQFGAEAVYCQIEKLTNLECLPHPTGFTVLVPPIRLAEASGAWSRVVALVPVGVPGNAT
jgi:kynurenine formamidase